ncbi:MAG: Gfo/Idh/MocA family oxidoreductase [Kiritimatiellae bacterium]|nr:Gfo/Idh/MocA family oxidoreductase [Kiritimatiellia bacterium]
MKKINVGVIGLGYAGKQHLDAYLKNPAVEVLMVSDASAETLAAVCRQHQLEGNRDYREIIKHPKIDLISICTPDYLHCEQAVCAALAGKHVLCEKPLATSLAECEKILAAVRQKKVKFLTGQVLRFTPLFLSLKKIVDSGAVGKPFFAESDYIHDIRPFLHGWRVNPQTAGDMILGGGCHPIDLLRWIVGEVREVYAATNKLALADAPFPADHMLISLKFADGAVGKVQISVGCRRPYALNLGVYGTKGTLINNRLFTENIPALEDFINLPLPTKAEYQYYDREIDELLKAIEEDREPAVNAADGAETVAVCLAAIESAKKNQPVAVKKFPGKIT